MIRVIGVSHTAFKDEFDKNFDFTDACFFFQYVYFVRFTCFLDVCSVAFSERTQNMITTKRSTPRVLVAVAAAAALLALPLSATEAKPSLAASNDFFLR